MMNEWWWIWIQRTILQPLSHTYEAALLLLSFRCISLMHNVLIFVVPKKINVRQPTVQGTENYVTCDIKQSFRFLNPIYNWFKKDPISTSGQAMGWATWVYLLWNLSKYRTRNYGYVSGEICKGEHFKENLFKRIKSNISD